MPGRPACAFLYFARPGDEKYAARRIFFKFGRGEPIGRVSEPFQGTMGLRKRRGGIGQAGKGARLRN
jgi:hypothetical protein